jgi:hypothetical protein
VVQLGLLLIFLEKWKYLLIQVANNFNNFFINVAKDIGNDNNLSAEEHPSIKIIKENKKEIPKSYFS